MRIQSMKQKLWRRQTLEVLEQEVWDEPPYSSHLVRRTFELRKVPLNLMDAEDLRIQIGQQFSLKYLMPLALEMLEKNLLVAGNYYEGDLLEVVLKLPEEYWQSNPESWKQLQKYISPQVHHLDRENIPYQAFLAYQVGSSKQM